MSILTVNELYELSERVEHIAIKLTVKGREAVIDDIMKLKDLLKVLSITLQVLHVFSHTNMNTFEANGNNIADVLANNGAKDSSNSRKNINGRRSYLSSSPQQIMENEKILTIPNNFNTTRKKDSFDNTDEINIYQDENGNYVDENGNYVSGPTSDDMQKLNTIIYNWENFGKRQCHGSEIPRGVGCTARSSP